MVVVDLAFERQVNDCYEWASMVDLYWLLSMKQLLDDDLMANDDHYSAHLLAKLFDCMRVVSNYLLYSDFVQLVENENNDDNDSMMLAMEMYEVYVGKKDRVIAAVAVAVDDELVVNTDEDYAAVVVVDDDEMITAYVVVVGFEVDNEM